MSHQFLSSTSGQNELSGTYAASNYTGALVLLTTVQEPHSSSWN